MKKLQAKLWKTHVAKGWQEMERSPAEHLALVHSEVSEALEALRRFSMEDFWQKPGKDGSICISTKKKEGFSPEGYFTELADTVIRICNIFSEYEKDLEYYIEEKNEYNFGRAIRHGGKKL